LTTGQDLLDEVFLSKPQVLHVEELSYGSRRSLGGVLCNDHDWGRSSGLGLLGLEEELSNGKVYIESSRSTGFITKGASTYSLTQRERLSLPFVLALQSGIPLYNTGTVFMLDDLLVTNLQVVKTRDDI
jgi:hypothetical protein